MAEMEGNEFSRMVMAAVVDFAVMTYRLNPDACNNIGWLMLASVVAPVMIKRVFGRGSNSRRSAHG